MDSPKPRGRIWFVLGAVVAALVGVAGGVFVGLAPMVERAALKALRKVEARFGVQISAGHVDWTWGGDVTVSDLRVTSEGETLMRAPHVSLSLDVSPWERRVRAVAIHVDQPTFQLRRDADGKTNVDRVLAGLRGGQAEKGLGAGSGVSIDPTPPAVAMEHATIEVVAALPKLPFGLTIPERMALRDGTITLTSLPDATAEEPHLEASARFADTTLDPGFGLELGATVSKTRGPERLAVSFSRPVRFMLGRRVVGFGGLAWSPAAKDGKDQGSFEVSSLQLSVPIDVAGGGANGVVAAAATCERLTLAPEPLSLLRRAGEAPTLAKLVKAVDAIEVTRPIMKIDLDPAGHHSFEDLFPRAESAPGSIIRAPSEPEPSLSRAATEASVAASDRLLAATGAAKSETLAARVAAKVEALARLSERVVPRAAAALDKLFLKSLGVTGGEVLLDLGGSSLDVTGLELRATVVDGQKHLGASFDAEEGLKVALTGHLMSDGALKVDTHLERVPVARVPAALLDTLHLGKEGTLTLVDLHFAGPANGQRWDLSGEVAVEDLVFHHPSVARDPLRDLDLGWKGRVSFDGAAGRITVADTRVTSKQVGAALDVDIAEGRTVPRVHVALDLPETPLQSVIDAIPAAMMPLLEGLRVDGTLRWPLSIDLDLAKPGDIQVHSDPVLSGFGVISMGRHVDFNELRGTHSYRIRLGDGTPGERLVGPYTGSWVPLESITPYLPAALTTTEDGTFYSNDGVSTMAMKESLSTNLDRGAFVRGASTITQQLVKNLYLGGEKTLSRKLQELFIAWQMTKTLSKGEIMALYLNAIEFGPGIYGIGDAAWYYFGKRAGDLTLTEAIYLASIVPGPRRYHYFFEEGKITERWRSYLIALLKVMLERQKITPDELEAAAPYEVRFRGTAAPTDDGDQPPPDFDEPPPDPGPDPE
ncbi:MAG: biosynthetic peptidoglycan transglycosylase [Myxococcota bacterium]